MAIEKQVIKNKKNYSSEDDRLKTMFNVQGEFAKRFYEVKSLPQAEREKWIKDMLVADIAESIELLEEINWKHWKKKLKKLDLEQARFEVADKMAFLMSIAMLLGMDAEMFFQFYMRKADVNVQRQENNY